MITPPEIEEYAERVSTPAPPHLAALHEATLTTQTATQMLSGTVEGRFLQMLVWAARPSLVLEIGTYTGSAAQFMAEALVPGGRLVTCEFDPERAAFAREHLGRSPVGDRVDVREGPALETIATLDGPFDVVFLDADKPSYVAYYEAVLPKLSERGLIVADNTLYSGEVLEPEPGTNAEELARFNEHVAADPRTVQVLLPIRDGVTLIRRA
ncbi:MAG: O-methyltransferase [Solirubrobacteraceae bacterium]|nr:O-methyltransferase [Solirubrobacteraceae bacterium]